MAYDFVKVSTGESYTGDIPSTIDVQYSEEVDGMLVLVREVVSEGDPHYEDAVVWYMYNEGYVQVDVEEKGGPGSGHHGHAGRPGEVGGSAPSKSLGDRLSSIKGKIAKAAQEVVDDWEQDEEGLDVIYGAGGICDDVCLTMGQVITDHIDRDLEIMDGGQPGDDHAWLVVLDTETGEAYGVDIPPGVYETGGGYSWRKIEGAQIQPSDVDIWKLDIDLAQPQELFGWKGGPGSGHYGHAGRPGQVGGSMPGKIWQGERQEPTQKRLPRLEVGKRGEEIAARVLSDRYTDEFVSLNEGINNAPIDLGGDHRAVEVKTGLVTNTSRAQHWRATIGQPGKAEAELLRSMTSEQKREHNRYKQIEIMRRKHDMLEAMSDMVGADVKPITIGVILSEDGLRGDVYEIPGFHLRLSWKTYATDKYYVGTYDYS